MSGEKKFTEKEIKAAIKEGAKKGQDLSGLQDLGGIAWFHVALTDCKGEFELVQHAMDGANAPVEGEERKGGAGGIAKFFLSANDEQLVAIGHIPPNLQDKGTTLEEWTAALTQFNKGEIVEGAKEHQIRWMLKKEADVFPLKERDAAIGQGFAFLRKKGFVPEEDESSDIDWEEAEGMVGVDL